jgi:hypothetical protein
MAAKKKFHFKKGSKITGLASMAQPYPTTYVHMNKMVVGMISPPSRFGHDNWIPMLLVKTETECGWKWIEFKAKFETEPEAREWFRKYQDKLYETYDIYEMEPWDN